MPDDGYPCMISVKFTPSLLESSGNRTHWHFQTFSDSHCVVATGVGGRPHERVLMNEKYTEENWASYSVLGGTKRLLAPWMGMYTIGLASVRLKTPFMCMDHLLPLGNLAQ
jgi:hypothetical protein